LHLTLGYLIIQNDKKFKPEVSNNESRFDNFEDRSVRINRYGKEKIIAHSCPPYHTGQKKIREF